MSSKQLKQKSLTKSNTSNTTVNKNNSKQLSEKNKQKLINTRSNRLSLSIKSKSKQKNKEKQKQIYKQYTRNLSKTLNLQSRKKCENKQNGKSNSKSKSKYNGKYINKQTNNKLISNQPKTTIKNQKTQLCSLQQQYIQCVTKVFNILDIFSRGTISQANISRWVPEAALYFLGSVFQKIRNLRISLTQKQFQNQCIRVLEKSSKQDISQFVYNIQKYNNNNDEKISLEGGEYKQTIQSQVQDKFSFQCQGGNTSFRKMKLMHKTMPLQTIASSEANITKQFIHQQIKFQKYREKQQNHIKINQRIKLTPLQNLNSFQNLATRHRKITDIQNLPLKITENVKKLQHKQSNQIHNNNNNDKIYRADISRNQSPYFKEGLISNVIAKNIGYRRRRQNLNSDRIDKLSMRLQDYIKQNAERIERSKNCRIQI